MLIGCTLNFPVIQFALIYSLPNKSYIDTEHSLVVHNMIAR